MQEKFLNDCRNGILETNGTAESMASPRVERCYRLVVAGWRLCMRSPIDEDQHLLLDVADVGAGACALYRICCLELPVDACILSLRPNLLATLTSSLVAGGTDAASPGDQPASKLFLYRQEPRRLLISSSITEVNIWLPFLLPILFFHSSTSLSFPS